jgi:chemotaxis protein CheC
MDVRKLQVINELIKEGATGAADSFSALAGIDTTVDIQNLSFVDPSDLPNEIGTKKLYNARISLSEPPYGVFMMTFSPSTAAEIAELMTQKPCDNGMSEFHRSAIQEMCNILTSGFIDGIANTLDTTIDMGTPTVDYTRGDKLAQEALTDTQRKTVAIVLDSVISVVDSNRDFNIRVFLIPDPGSFVNMMDMLDLDIAEEGDKAPAW